MLVAVMVVYATPLSARVVVSEPFQLSDRHPAGTRHQGIILRGALRLRRPAGTLPLAQLSGLAWDADEGLLYALSDDGYLVHLRPRFDNGNLATVIREAHYPLRDEAGDPLDGYAADSESLAIRCSNNGVRGDSELFVGFEITPRIVRFDTQGRFLATETLPEELAESSSYANPNQGLEAIGFDTLGRLWIAPERPLRHTGSLNRLYPGDELSWAFELADENYGAVTALTTTTSGHPLIIERRFVSILTPLRITLRLLRMTASNFIANVETIAVFDGAHGWRVDNFEGLARHEGERYFMVSDDNNSRLQRTLLVYFELRTPPGEPVAATAPAAAASVRPDYTGGCGNRAGAR